MTSQEVTSPRSIWDIGATLTPLVRCPTIVPAVACRATAATDPRNKTQPAPSPDAPDATTIPPGTCRLRSTSSDGYQSDKAPQTGNWLPASRVETDCRGRLGVRQRQSLG